MKYISDSQVAEILDYRGAADAIRAAFRALGNGRASVQTRLRTVSGIGKLSTIGAILDDENIAGAKVYTTSPTGQFCFMIVLFDPVDGVWLAAMDGGHLTRVRTAATSLMVAEMLADPDSNTLALFGTGVQAESHAHALVTGFPIERILVSHYRDAAAFGDRLHAELGVEVVQVEPGEAVRSADLIVTATRSHSPLFSSGDVKPGAHVTSIGATLASASEVDPQLPNLAEVVAVESVDQARHEAGNLISAVSHGSFSWSEAIELADLLENAQASHQPGRISFFDSLGIGLEDVAVATLVYRRTR